MNAKMKGDVRPALPNFLLQYFRAILFHVIILMSPWLKDPTVQSAISKAANLEAPLETIDLTCSSLAMEKEEKQHAACPCITSESKDEFVVVFFWGGNLSVDECTKNLL